MGKFLMQEVPMHLQGTGIKHAHMLCGRVTNVLALGI